MRRSSIGLVTLALGVSSLFACSDEASTASAGAGTFAVVVSGEEAGLDGFRFPPTPGDEVTFVDGWQVTFTRVLVSVGEVTLSENPDKVPTDQAQTDGVVARATGPWVLDVHKEGTNVPYGQLPAASLKPQRESDADGEGPVAGRGSKSDPAIRLVKIANQNANGGRAFDLTRRYALGFKTVPASAGATKVNLDASDDPAYGEMVAKGWSIYYEGTAVFKGDAASCKTSGAYDFASLPNTVQFKFGFATPSEYLNCQNTDLTGQAFPGEEKQRGVQPSANGPTYLQMTFHLDHPFWSTTDHEAAKPYFDQFAALARNGVVTLDDLVGADPTSFNDRAGKAIPWRTCDATVGLESGSVRSFDVTGLTVNPSGDPATAIRDYADYVRYLQSTQGHLNADGLCAVRRSYPSPK